mmetsp:Transcript_6185/g.12050  ORF Transcript_6185/g.12050 Transcript_6185/m.12050 type:complete len:212 (+) Transcript_6185:96-731(+)
MSGSEPSTMPSELTTTIPMMASTRKSSRHTIILSVASRRAMSRTFFPAAPMPAWVASTVAWVSLIWFVCPCSAMLVSLPIPSMSLTSFSVRAKAPMDASCTRFPCSIISPPPAAPASNSFFLTSRPCLSASNSFFSRARFAMSMSFASFSIASWWACRFLSNVSCASRPTSCMTDLNSKANPLSICLARAIRSFRCSTRSCRLPTSLPFIS